MPAYRGEYEKELRPFFDAMRHKLAVNKNRGTGWTTMSLQDLFARCREELDELEEAVGNGNTIEIVLEAADVANFAMMISHNAMALAVRGEPSGPNTVEEQFRENVARYDPNPTITIWIDPKGYRHRVSSGVSVPSSWVPEIPGVPVAPATRRGDEDEMGMETDESYRMRIQNVARQKWMAGDPRLMLLSTSGGEALNAYGRMFDLERCPF